MLRYQHHSGSQSAWLTILSPTHVPALVLPDLRHHAPCRTGRCDHVSESLPLSDWTKRFVVSERPGSEPFADTRGWYWHEKPRSPTTEGPATNRGDKRPPLTHKGSLTGDSAGLLRAGVRSGRASATMRVDVMMTSGLIMRPSAGVALGGRPLVGLLRAGPARRSMCVAQVVNSRGPPAKRTALRATRQPPASYRRRKGRRTSVGCRHFSLSLLLLARGRPLPHARPRPTLGMGAGRPRLRMAMPMAPPPFTIFQMRSHTCCVPQRDHDIRFERSAQPEGLRCLFHRIPLSSGTPKLSARGSLRPPTRSPGLYWSPAPRATSEGHGTGAGGACAGSACM